MAVRGSGVVSEFDGRVGVVSEFDGRVGDASLAAALSIEGMVVGCLVCMVEPRFGCGNGSRRHSIRGTQPSVSCSVIWDAGTWGVWHVVQSVACTAL